jgi:ubiquitin carboxyl-terminal hydrolase 36/42
VRIQELPSFTYLLDDIYKFIYLFMTHFLRYFYFCDFYRLTMDVWASSTPNKSISPRSMVQNIRRVGRQFRPMRQEDAHEYLRQLLDCMHEEMLKANNVKTSDGKIAETTLISRVFGGYLCNELKCSVCTYSSKTFNHFQDLSLEVSGGISSGNFNRRFFILEG